MIRLFLPVMLVLLLVPASARGQQPVPDNAPSPNLARIAGCYRLRVGSWSDSNTAVGPTGLRIHRMRLPDVVQLDTARYGRLPSHFRRLSPQSPELEGRRALPPGWRILSPDSVELFWSTGYTGIRVIVTSRGATLRGYAEAFSDVGGSPRPRGVAQLERSSCPTASGSDSIKLLHNYRLQLSGATFKEAIAFRVLQVHHKSALSRAFESTACS